MIFKNRSKQLPAETKTIKFPYSFTYGGKYFRFENESALQQKMYEAARDVEQAAEEDNYNWWQQGELRNELHQRENDITTLNAKLEAYKGLLAEAHKEILKLSLPSRPQESAAGEGKRTQDY